MDNFEFGPLHIALLLFVAILVYLWGRQRCQKPVSQRLYIAVIVWFALVWACITYSPVYTWYVIFVPIVLCVVIMVYYSFSLDQLIDWLNDQLEGNGDGQVPAEEEEPVPVPPQPVIPLLPTPQPAQPVQLVYPVQPSTPLEPSTPVRPIVQPTLNLLR